LDASSGAASAPAATSTAPPLVNAASPPPTAAPPTANMHAIVGYGYGCGGHCAFNWRGESSVSITFHTDGSATLRDSGSTEQTSAAPDGFSSSRRSWTLAWLGTWSGDLQKRTLSLTSVESSCHVKAEGRNAEADGNCPAVPGELTIACEWGAVPAPDDLAEAPSPEQAPLTAWVCSPTPALEQYPGTEFPWALGLPGLERKTVGEPRPTTSYELPAKPAANAAPR